MNRIKSVSAFFKVLFQITFILIPLLNILGWINAPNTMYVIKNASYSYGMDVIPNVYKASNPHGGVLHVLSNSEKFQGFLISTIPMAIELFIVYSLIRLFGLYKKGEIFSYKNVNCIRDIGYALLLSELVNPFYQGLLGLVLTWNNPHGHRYAAISFDQTNVGILLISLLVILISWIMKEAYKLREEQQLTI